MNAMLCSKLNFNTPSNLLNSLPKPFAKEGKMMKLVVPLTQEARKLLGNFHVA